MNTYRVYVLDRTVALEPNVAILYLRAEKYGPAWQGARAALDSDKAAKAPKLFADPECSIPAKIKAGDKVTVGAIDDIKPRNVKLDKTALLAVLNDPKATDADKVAAMKALV